MKKVLAAVGAASLGLAGCATSSSKIMASYSSPMVFNGYSCRQLAFEDEELLSRVSALGGQIDRRATNDKVAMGVGIILFSPALFLVRGDGEEAVDYAQLKGRHEAITHAAALKGCVAGGRPGAELSAYAPAMTAQPYVPQPAPVAYTAAAAPQALAPTVRTFSEVERLHPAKAMVDNYGRQDGP